VRRVVLPGTPMGSNLHRIAWREDEATKQSESVQCSSARRERLSCVLPKRRRLNEGETILEMCMEYPPVFSSDDLVQALTGLSEGGQ
jgi:hypothetical protein